MIFVEPYAELLEEKNPLIKIERVGRLCYKSKSDYTEETALAFVNRLIKSKHFAMLEHAVFTFYYPEPEYKANITSAEETYGGVVSPIINYKSDLTGKQLITLNLRVIIENNLVAFAIEVVNKYPIFSKLACAPFDEIPANVSGLSDLERAKRDLLYPKVTLIEQEEVYGQFKYDVPDVKKHIFLTFHIVCDRGVSHEIVRHRVASYAQESTRYCNYGKRGGLSFIEPCWEMSEEERATYNECLKKIEETYLFLVNNMKVAPQKARYVLPNGLKTELFMTASISEYTHFLNLRYYGVTGSPHPQMKEIATYMVDDILKYH